MALSLTYDSVQFSRKVERSEPARNKLGYTLVVARLRLAIRNMEYLSTRVLKKSKRPFIKGQRMVTQYEFTDFDIKISRVGRKQLYR